MLNATQTTLTTTTPIMQFATALLLIAAILGMVIYVICVAAVVRDKMYRMPYYALLLGLSIADIIGLCCFVFFALPLAISGVELGGSPENIGVGVILQFGWFSALPFVCLLAVNRAICLHSSSMAKKKTSTSTWLQIGGCYIFGFLVALPSATQCCRILWWSSEFTWIYEPTIGASMIAIGELCCLGVVGFTLVICFGLALHFICRWKKQLSSNLVGKAAKDHSKKMQEIKLFLQVFLTTINLVLFEMFFLITPLYVSDPLIGFTSSALYISNCSINGYIYLTMNTKINHSVKIILRIGKQQIVVFPMRYTGAATTHVQAPTMVPFGGIGGTTQIPSVSRYSNCVGLPLPESVQRF